MRFEFIPQRGDHQPKVHVSADVLTLDGAQHDFSDLPEGKSRAVFDPWIAGPVRREAGQVVVPLILPHGFDAPEETRFPQPIETDTEGFVVLPAPHAPADEIEDDGA